MVFGKCDNSLDTHLGKHKNLIFNIVRQMAKIIEFYLRIQMLPAKLASLQLGQTVYSRLVFTTASRSHYG